MANIETLNRVEGIVGAEVNSKDVEEFFKSELKQLGNDRQKLREKPVYYTCKNLLLSKIIDEIILNDNDNNNNNNNDLL